MMAETGVLGGDGGCYEIGRKLIETDEGTVLDMEGGEHLAPVRDYLRSQLAVRMLQLLERRDAGEKRDEKKQERDQHEGRGDQDPEPFYDFFLCFVFHFLIFD